MSKLFDITCILDRECQHIGQLDLTLSGFEITLYILHMYFAKLELRQSETNTTKQPFKSNLHCHLHQ